MFLQPEHLSPAALREINWWYVYQARDKQCPPEGDWFGWLIRSGRGFGKTRTGAEWVIDRARQGYKRIALIGQTVADVRDVMIETEDCSILNISPSWFMPEYEPTKRRLTWPNGALASTYSGDKPDQLRGPQHDTVWIDELAKFKYPKLTWDNMELGLRIGDNPQVCVTTTPRPIPIIKELLADEAVEDVQGSTYENIANLADRFRQRVLARYEGTHLGKQELYGEVLEDNPRALWKRKDIEDYRLTKAPELVRIVVGVDPTGGVADCGIVAAGHGRGKHAFVLDDESLLESPGEWAKAAVTLYHKLKADRIVGEANYGGKMVEFTVRTADPDVSYKDVYVKRGKEVRAEPVAALYEQGRVHHVGTFAELEQEMCMWVPGENMPSPNRLDALVIALSELMLEKQYKPVRLARYA